MSNTVILAGRIDELRTKHDPECFFTTEGNSYKKSGFNQNANGDWHKKETKPPGAFIKEGTRYVPSSFVNGQWIYEPEASSIEPKRKSSKWLEPTPTMKSLSERRAEIEARPIGEDLINDWLPTSPTLLLIAGRPGIGKTFVLLDLLCCLASGIPYLSHKCKQVKVGLLSLEGDERKLLRRIDTLIAESYPIAETNFAWTHTIPVKLDSPKGREFLQQQLTDKQVVGIDTLTKLCGGDINSPKEVAAFLAILKEVMVNTGASVIGTHHCRKPDKRIKIAPSDLIFEIRGAVDFVAEAQSVLLLERTKQTKDEFGKFDSNTAARSLYTAKLKDSPTDEDPIELAFNDAKLRYLPIVKEYQDPF